MPHATATWLIDNTGLSFEQIAEFCGLHILEVQAMADDLAGSKYTGRDPVHSGELTHAEIEKGQADPGYRLLMQKAPVEASRTKGPRYTPVSKRQDRPNAILWLVRNHPELKDAQIMRLVGTTKSTIQSVRERTHWNSPHLQPMDPVTLGLASQIDLDFEVQRAAKEKPAPAQEHATLLPASETTTPKPAPEPEQRAEQPKKEGPIDVDSVFAKLGGGKRAE
jgi:hypothetical protein